ncbi:MAG: murein biosynthesis integral membrane protein MurJ [Pseudomonadota bacterium]
MSRGRLGALSVVGGMTLLSRVLGLVREVFFARFLGAAGAMDAFVIAFQIPNFLRRMFAEGAFSQAFVPVLSEYRKNRPHDEVQGLVDRVAGSLTLVLFVITVLGVIGAPVLIWLSASGFQSEPDKFELATDLLRITFPYLMFISLTALSAGILNTYDRFAVPAFTPVLLNVCLITAVIFGALHTTEPVRVLAWGVFVAGAAQLFFQWPFLRRLRLLPRPKVNFRDDGVRRILSLMLPAMFGASIAQINLLIDRRIAAELDEGSVSWLYFSDRLLEFPLGVFAIALGTVVLPGLSRRKAEADADGFARTLDWGLRWVAVIAVPAACGLFVLAGPMIATVYLYGEFTPRDMDMVRIALMAYALGLVGISMIKVLVPGYFARQDTRTPVRIGVIAMLINVVANIVLVAALVWADQPAPHAGLALATGLSAWINALLLLRGLRAKGVYRAGGGWWKLVCRVALAAITMSAVLWSFAGTGVDWFAMNSGVRVFRLTALIALGALIYGTVLFATGWRPREMLERPA